MNNESVIANRWVFSFLISTVVGTLVFGLWGYLTVLPKQEGEEWTYVFDAIYSALHLFTQKPALMATDENHWAISLGRILSIVCVYFTIITAGAFTLRKMLKSHIMGRTYKQHYVVVGLTDNSISVARNLILAKQKVVVILDEEDSIAATELERDGAIVIYGTLEDSDVFVRANILSAKSILLMSGEDLHNLDLLDKVIALKLKQELDCYLELNQATSYKLFEPDSHFSIANIKQRSPLLSLDVFDLNELAAVEVLQVLGGANDTLSAEGEPVKVLIAGFGQIGQTLLRVLLEQAHFPNQKPVQVTVVVSFESEMRHFLSYHHQIMKHNGSDGLKLWNIKFVDDMNDVVMHAEYDHLFFCYEQQETALSRAIELFEVREYNQSSVTSDYHYYSRNGYDIKHQCIQMFGCTNQLASYQGFILGENTLQARQTHYAYVCHKLGVQVKDERELHTHLLKYDATQQNSSQWLAWLNLPLFKRRSNIAEQHSRHLKLKVLGQAIPDENWLLSNQNAEFECLPYIDELQGLDRKLLAGWVQHILERENITLEQLSERIHLMAQAEHQRWNAFHIVRNWRYGQEKNEQLKTHDCLLNWPDLVKLKPDTIKYDYNNIYHLAQQNHQNVFTAQDNK